MQSTYLASPLLFLIQVAFGFYSLLLLLRFLLQLVQSHFYNPISQMIVKLTVPVLRPLRRIIPSYHGVDLSSLIAAWATIAIENLLTLLVVGYTGNYLSALPWAVPKLVALLFSILIFAIVIRAILSWFPATHGHPITHIVDRLSHPVLSRVQRFVPDMGGIDLSPMAAIILLILVRMLVLPPLYTLFGVPPLLQQ